MKFVPVAGTQVLFSVWDTRVQDFETFVKSTATMRREACTPLVRMGGSSAERHGRSRVLARDANHPVVGVSWNDAEEFCKWLTKREQSCGRSASKQRIPATEGRRMERRSGLEE